MLFQAALAKEELRKRTNIVRELESIKDENSSPLYKVTLVLLGLGVVAGAAFVGFRYYKQRS